MSRAVLGRLQCDVIQLVVFTCICQLSDYALSIDFVKVVYIFGSYSCLCLSQFMPSHSSMPVLFLQFL